MRAGLEGAEMVEDGEATVEEVEAGEVMAVEAVVEAMVEEEAEELHD